MPQWIALLRGINLGSRNQVSMPELRDLLERAGYEGVETYLRSGNVILHSAKQPSTLAADIHRLVQEHFAVEAAVVVRSPEAWRSVIEADPFSNHPKQDDPRMRHVIFLSAPPDPGSAEPLQEADWGDDALTIGQNEVFITYADGMQSSRLQHNKVLKQLGVNGTARNWRTILAIAERLDRRSGSMSRSPSVHRKGTQR